MVPNECGEAVDSGMECHVASKGIKSPSERPPWSRGIQLLLFFNFARGHRDHTIHNFFLTRGAADTVSYQDTSLRYNRAIFSKLYI